MNDSSRKGPILAQDLVERIAKDPKHQAVKAVLDEARAERTSQFRIAEEPIVKDLRDNGLQVGSVWDLVNTGSPYPEVLPVLLRHLKRGGYPDRVMDSLARALTVKPDGTAYWDDLRDEYERAAPESEVASGLANALGVLAARRHYLELTRLVMDDERGSERLMMLKAIKRLGGDSGRQILSGLGSHPLLGKEATHLLKTRTRR